jgi:hypothetical protein
MSPEKTRRFNGVQAKTPADVENGVRALGIDGAIIEINVSAWSAEVRTFYSTDEVG